LRPTGSCGSGDSSERYYDGFMTDQPLEPEEPATVVSSPPPADEHAEGEPSSATPLEQRGLRRSRDDRVLAGVCGGLGKYLGVDPVLIRIAAVILVFAGGAGILLYIIGWIAIPEELEAGAAVAPASTAEPAERTRGAIILGFVFVVLGIFFLLDELWPDFLSWQYMWPIALIAVGVAIIVRQRQ
jgi:phage shock protein C